MNIYRALYIYMFLREAPKTPTPVDNPVALLAILAPP